MSGSILVLRARDSVQLTEPARRFGIESAIHDANPRHTRRNTREALVIEAEKQDVPLFCGGRQLELCLRQVQFLCVASNPLHSGRLCFE
jgi:hypothetical protein